MNDSMKILRAFGLICTAVGLLLGYQGVTREIPARGTAGIVWTVIAAVVFVVGQVLLFFPFDRKHKR